MGQPKKEIPPVRTRKLTIRLTEEMYEVLHQDAEAAQISDSECVRQMILKRKINYAPTVVHDDSAILEALHSISHLGNNLNQIARYLNGGGNMTNPLAKDVREALQKINDCCNRLNKEMEKEYGSH